tara:strand:+ start:552 stop:1427 length:876 start_codon:yes stop_codon:yes gene_type:complete
MRLGLNTFLVSPGFTDADLPLIQNFKSYGAEVVELAIVDPAAVTMSRLVQTLDSAGFRQTVVCGTFGLGRDLRGNSEEQANSTRYIIELIEIAKRLGSKVVCGPMYSSVGRTNRHSPQERESQLQLIAENLKPLCKRAEDAGVVLAIEPLNRFETDCINTVDQALDLIDRVGSPALKIHIDTFHMNIEEDDSSNAILKAGQHIGHVHASASHRGLLGQDQVDWEGVLGALLKIGYDEDIVIESFCEDNAVIAKAAAIWRKLYDSPQQLSIEGLAFLENNLKRLKQRDCKPV